MKNSQQYMQNRIRFLLIMSRVALVLMVAIIGVIIYAAFVGALVGIETSIATSTGTGNLAVILVPAVLVVVVLVVGLAIFSGLIDQGAILQTALNLETNSTQLIEEMRLINKYLRAVIPFQGGRADEKP